MHGKRERDQDQREQHLQPECVLVFERRRKTVKRIKKRVADALQAGLAFVWTAHVRDPGKLRPLPPLPELCRRRPPCEIEFARGLDVVEPAHRRRVRRGLDEIGLFARLAQDFAHRLHESVERLL